jgi:tRNA(Ile)-lysidine synthase
MHALERRLLHTLRARALIAPGTRGLVCVSGGADSLALLHLLHALHEPLAARLDVLHFDHGLRPESGVEADWVARQAGTLGLPCHILRAPHLAGRRAGVQAAARAWRRAESRRLAAQWDATWVATGHQRDDHLETLLLKWLRGAHISNLRGMAWREGPFVRPLLDLPHAELCAYLTSRGVTWLEDPSNLAPRYKRNRVRHELLPLLDDLTGGGVGRRLAALEAQSAQVRELITTVLAARLVPESPPGQAGAGGDVAHWLDAAALAALPRLAAATRLHDFVQARLPGALAAGQVERALELLAAGGPTWTLELSRGRRLHRRGARLLLHAAAADAPGPEALVTHELGGHRVRAPATWRVHAAAAYEPGLTLHNLAPRAELLLRRRTVGDRFHPPWKPHPVKLARFLRDQRVPPWARDALPVVVLEGQVIAVCPDFVARGFDAPALPDPVPPLRLSVQIG